MREDTQQDLSDFFEENGMEAISSLMGMVTTQQKIALGLTQLVLQYGTGGRSSKNDIFEIYEDACDLLKQQNKELEEAYS